MSEQREKARPRAGTQGQAKNEENRAGTSSKNHFDTAPSGCQVEKLLLRGKENGIHARDLRAVMCVDTRTLRHMIHRERLEGALILADTVNGYYLPGSADELRHFRNQMRSRCRQIEKAVRAAEEALAGMEGDE